MLPNFLGIGAQRCGTSWLYECLRVHPEIYMPKIKELNFFSDIGSNNFSKGINWYKSFFINSYGHKMRGEITPEYLLDDKAPHRIKKILKDVKLIIIVRNPINRAISSYGKGLREGHWNCSFESFLDNNIDYCIDRGFYFRQIRRYLNIFPENRLIIKVYEDIEKDSLSFLKDIYTFLCVDSNFVPSVINNKFNVGIIKKTVQLKIILILRDVIYKIPYLKYSIKLFQRNSLINKLLQLILKKENFNISSDTRKKLINIYEYDVFLLSRLLKRNLLKEWFDI